MLRPMVSAVKAVERSLTLFGVAVREPHSSPTVRLEYVQDYGKTLAVVNWSDEMTFVGHPDAQVVSLIRAHHALATAS
jgi:hypothetical protein